MIELNNEILDECLLMLKTISALDNSKFSFKIPLNLLSPKSFLNNLTILYDIERWRYLFLGNLFCQTIIEDKTLFIEDSEQVISIIKKYDCWLYDYFEDLASDHVKWYKDYHELEDDEVDDYEIFEEYFSTLGLTCLSIKSSLFDSFLSNNHRLISTIPYFIAKEYELTDYTFVTIEYDDKTKECKIWYLSEAQGEFLSYNSNLTVSEYLYNCFIELVEKSTSSLIG